MNSITDQGALGWLTPRRIEVIRLIANGKKNLVIAAELGISVKTVETHRMFIYGKLQVHNTAQLIRAAMRLKIELWPADPAAASEELREPPRLTPRQSEIFRLLLDGKENHQIAAQLFVARATVDAHRDTIYKIYRVHGIAELIREAVRFRLLAVDQAA